MTRDETIAKGILLWSWLKDTPPTTGDAGLEKQMAYKALGLEWDMRGCPMCQQASDGVTTNSINCRKCVVWSEDVSCTARGQPYPEWLDAISGYDKEATAIAAGRVLALILSAKERVVK